MPQAPPENSTAAYVAPFLVFVSLMSLEKVFGLPVEWWYPVRCAATLLCLVLVTRRVPLLPERAWASVSIGTAVFLIWIAPDLLFGQAYRHFRLFENPLTGSPVSTLPLGLRTSPWFLTLRTASCALLVPVMEELFWRGWLMRWIIDRDFWKVPLGTCAPAAFWTVALLFASEHGPYWDVGLLAGVAYNWWMVRRRSLADCILAHGVTNALLSVYVLWSGQFQYWS